MTGEHERLLAHNVRSHNRIARRYAATHGEIYNDLEQARLRNELAEALSLIEPANRSPLALDFGCGAGNLTDHLSNLGCHVIAADVSRAFLDLIKAREFPTEVETMHLNGRDLSKVPDNAVDMVATYSVLHHVPDYLSLIREFLRVTRPGGVIYIDHEASPRYWDDPQLYLALRRRISTPGAVIRKYLRPRNYIHWLIRRFVDPRYSPEGDIHVHHDDHIEWERIRELLEAGGCDVMIDKDYLLYREGYVRAKYDAIRDAFGDMHVMVAVKCS